MNHMHAPYPPTEEVMGPVLAAIANGTLIRPRPPPRTPRPLPVIDLPPLTEAEAQQIDHCMWLDKQPRPGHPLMDGYEQRRLGRATQLQHRYEGFS